MNPILLACPVSDAKDYIIRPWVNHVRSLAGMFDMFFVDNSKNESWGKRVSRELDIPVQHISSFNQNSFTFICHSRNVIRDHFLRKNYRFFFSLECDVFPPLDIIPILLSHHKRICGCTYHLGVGDQSPLMVQEIENFDAHVPMPRESRNLSVDESFEFFDGRLKKVFSIGMGCLLIKRSVINQIKFRITENPPVHDDSYFAADCYQSGIPIFCDTSVLPMHRNKPWSLDFNP